jgi:DNA repair exonuclease SbcCD ATPase subunit
MSKQSASARRAARTAKAEAKRKEREERRAQALANHAEIQANKEAAKQAALDDLEQEGKNVAVLVEKIKQYEKSAEEKAGGDLKKAQDFRDTLAKELARIEPKCKAAGMKVADFKKKYAPDFGRTKLYELLRIGRGDTTTEEARAHKTEKKRQERAAKSSATSDVADTLRTATGDKLDTSVLGSKAAEQLGKHMAGSAERRIEEVKAHDIKTLLPDDRPEGGDGTGEPVDGATFVDTPEKKSKRLLMSGKATLDEILHDMTTEDRSALFDYFKFHPTMVGVKRKAA